LAPWLKKLISEKPELHDAAIKSFNQLKRDEDADKEIFPFVPKEEPVLVTLT
jgi:hypothetical protein